MDVYVYTMARDGEVIERKGVISRQSTKMITITVRDGQRLTLGKKSGVITKDAMWSRYPQKHVYIEKMLDVLMERRAMYQERLRTTTCRINGIRQCAG